MTVTQVIHPELANKVKKNLGCLSSCSC